MNQSKTFSFGRWLILLSFLVGFGLSAVAESVEIDGLYYELNTSTRTATLTYQSTGSNNYSAIPADLTIPSSVTYNGVAFTVTTIADRAFANCTALESISIPESVTTLGTTVSNSSSSATSLPFYNCTSLKTVRFEDSSSAISLGVSYNSSSSSYRKGLFYYAPLEEVYIGRNITYRDYGTSTYYSFANLPEYYGYSAFYNQPKLTKVTIGETVTEIPSHLFYKCTQLTTLEITSNSLSVIPKYAFSECNISDLTLPNTIKTIGEYAFSSNSGLMTANIGNSVESIGNYAFSDCNILTNVNLGNSLLSIGDYAFQNLGKSTSEEIALSLPETLQSIGQYAFASSRVSSFNIPNSVTTIGQFAFSSNKILKSFILGSGCKTLSEGMFSGCSSLTDVKLSEGLLTIPDRAFANCTALESISIPGSVTTLGTTVSNSSSSATSLPFYNCTSLKTVRFEDSSSAISLGVSYNSSSSSYCKGLFYYAPLEEVYIGRNITYRDYGTSTYYSFANLPEYYGYSAFYNQPKLTKVTIGETVTEIPAYLFYKNTSITLMTLPKVQSIGTAAFKECSKLTTLNLGNALTSVGDEAFYECTNVTKLTFPNTTQSIGTRAFYNCSSVTEVTVGTGIKSIGESGFYGCKSFTALILPDGFTTMGSSAFEGCTKLTVAKLGISLTNLPTKAFKNCPSLSEMVIPATVETIGDQALYNDSGLATITMNEGLKTIGNEVFWNNSGVMQFTIPGTVTSIGENCFYGCTRVTYLTFREGTETLTLDNDNCRSSKIDALTTTSNYKNRYYDYFYDCPIRFLTLGRNLKYSYSNSVSIYDVNGTTFKYVTRASAPFINNTELRSVRIGANVTFLWHHLLNGCRNVTKLDFPAGLNSVYSYAFANCDGLTTLTFPNPLVLLDNFACLNNVNLTSVVFNEEAGNNLSMTIGDGTFSSCSKISSLTFPAKTASIGNYCFKNASGLIDIRFTDSSKAIFLGYGAANESGYDTQSLPMFGNSSLQSLYLGRNIEYNATSSYGYSPFARQNFMSDVKFSDAGTVTYCKDYLLYDVSNCETLKLPESLTSIGNYTFSGMTALNGITIPNKVTIVGTYAFSHDTALKYANLSSSCSWLKEGLFSSCETLEGIFIPSVVTKMDRNIFANCLSLTSATFEGNSDILEMGYGASKSNYGLFRDCPLETLNLDRWLSYNTDVASRSPFYSIATLKNLALGENVGVIDKYMFSYCTGLEELYLPDNIESVGLWGFRGCSSLKSVRFSEKLSQVSDCGFSECTSLDNVVFPASMTSIADNSFSNCTSLKKLDLGTNLMIIGPAAFKNDSSLESIKLPESLYGLGVEAFANCTSLPNVIIQGISSVGKQAFQNCTGLKWVSLSDKTTSLGEDSFAGCPNIAYVKSYAEFPPEGLINFVESVPKNGTLFVPEYSIDYYAYSPTWETWLDIRPLNENVLVSSITLDQSEVSFKATENVQLTAMVGTTDATNKDIHWNTADEKIATVDETGLLTGVSVGETIITALAADGSGVKAECKVTVVPTMVESITINYAGTSLKKGRTLELSATVLPSSATDGTFTWSTSDTSIATIDADGVVTGVAAGDVNIIATANDGSGITTSYTLTILRPTKGDSNDNDVVTISDAVHTANYAVGITTDTFNFEAADVNEDNRITLSDASATAKIVLEQSLEASSRALVRTLALADDDGDCLVIEDFTGQKGDTKSIMVNLENKIDYVAMQADITVPDGLTLAAVKIGNRAEANHSLISKRIDERSMRVALFDVNNSTFADNGGAILELVVKVDNPSDGNITINNILASDADAREYTLISAGGKIDGTSAIDSIEGNNIRIETSSDAITVINAEGLEIAIYTVDGTMLTHVKAASDHEMLKVVSGVYIVVVGETAEKVIVK